MSNNITVTINQSRRCRTATYVRHIRVNGKTHTVYGSSTAELDEMESRWKQPEPSEKKSR